jgi:hypothetical protein
MLRRQGFVVSELRRGQHIYKLRFRVGSRQHVRYIGSDPRVAVQVERELNELQKNRHDSRQLAALKRTAGSRLKEAKLQLTPVLETHGFHFHGQAIRRRRWSKLRHKALS